MTAWYQRRRVLITGASGFVGARLTQELVTRGARVIALIRDHAPHFETLLQGPLRNVTVVWGDVEDFQLMERIINEYDVELCFHLAAQSLVGTANRSPLSTFETNIRGTWNVLEAVRRLGTSVRVVVASSDKAYGEPPVAKFTEELPVAGRHPYDVSKSCADLLAQTYASTYGMPVGIVRCGNIYGEGDRNFNRIIPETMRAILRDEPPPIRSDGTLVRDYVYVGDAVDAYLLVGERLHEPEVRGQAFNFSGERSLSVLELVQLILRLAGRTDLKPRIFKTATGEIKEQSLCCDKARRVLGWRSRMSLEEGLAHTYRWYEGSVELHEGLHESRCVSAHEK